MRPDKPSARARACTASFIQGNPATQREGEYIPGCRGRAVVGRARPHVLFRHSSLPTFSRKFTMEGGRRRWWEQAAALVGAAAGAVFAYKRWMAYRQELEDEQVGTRSTKRSALIRGPWRGMHVSHVRALTVAGAGGHGLLCQQFKCTATA